MSKLFFQLWHTALKYAFQPCSRCIEAQKFPISESTLSNSKSQTEHRPSHPPSTTKIPNLSIEREHSIRISSHVLEHNNLTLQLKLPFVWINKYIFVGVQCWAYRRAVRTFSVISNSMHFIFSCIDGRWYSPHYYVFALRRVDASHMNKRVCTQFMQCMRWWELYVPFSILCIFGDILECWRCAFRLYWCSQIFVYFFVGSNAT